jgi:hypothetical protein
MASGHKLVYLALLLGPFVGLWLLEPLLFLGALPDLAINLLSSKSDQTVIVYHWTSGIVPFTVAASVLGAARLKRDPDRTSLYALVATACVAVISPLYLVLAQGDIAAALPSNAGHRAKAYAIGLVPAGVPVSASNELGTYLSARRYVYLFPVVGKARWLVIDRHDRTYSDSKGYARAVRRAESRPGWTLVYSSHDVHVLHRTAPHG